MIPGSPFSQACLTIRSKTSLAFNVPTICFIAGIDQADRIHPVSSASMKASVNPTEMLKLFSCFWSDLQRMNSRMSG